MINVLNADNLVLPEKQLSQAGLSFKILDFPDLVVTQLQHLKLTALLQTLNFTNFVGHKEQFSQICQTFQALDLAKSVVGDI